MMRKYFISFFTIYFYLSLCINVNAQDQKNKVSSQGGGKSEGGQYTNFSVIGGDIVNKSISGGQYFGQSGFLYSAFGRTAATNSQDSLALVALYDSTNGPEWSNNTNWLKGALNTWHGVVLNAAGGVDSLKLANNNLQGVIPPSISNLTDLNYLDLSSNKISGILPVEMGNLSSLNYLSVKRNLLEGEIPADLFNIQDINFLGLDGNNFIELPEIDTTSSIVNRTLATLNLANNYLTFEDFQRFDNRDSIQGYFYPQKLLVPTYDTLVNAGSELRLTFNIKGTGNTYQWRKDGEDISNATNDTLLITNISEADIGFYQLVANNGEVPDLELITEVFYVSVEGTGAVLAEGPEWTSARAYGGGKGNFTAAIEVDNQENILMYGNFSGAFDFFGQQITEADSGAYLAKLDKDYNIIWLKHIFGGKASRDIGDYFVYEKGSGANYIAGTFTDKLVIDNLSYTSGNPGSKVHYVAKIDALGAPEWIKEYPLNSTVNDLSAANNALVVSGIYDANITLEGKTLTNKGSNDFFVAGYLPDGQNTFVKAAGGTSNEYLVITAIDNSGNIYATSEATSESLTFEDGSTFAMAEGAGNVLLIKYDAAGNIIWNKTYSGSSSSNGDYSSWPTAITIDPADNPILMGWFGTKSGFGTDTLTSPFSYNKYITQIAPDGSVNWAKPILEEKYGFNYNEMETDKAGNIYFMSSQAGDLFISGSKLAAEGAGDKYIIKYSNTGEVRWVKRASSTAPNAVAQGLGVVAEDILYMGGSLGDSHMEFGNFSLNNPDLASGFIASIGANYLSQDSLALVSLYNATGGDNWNNNTGWLSSPVSEWTGITLSNGRVAGISLPDNNLSGTIPKEINTIDSLSTLELANNEIDALPSMAQLPKLSLLDISGNNLEFGSLEPNIDIPGIKYNDQDSIGTLGYIEIPAGTDTTISITTSGSANSYQWYLNDQLIDQAVNSTYRISNISKATMGEYFVEVTNSNVPGLTLTGRLNIVNATANLSGQVKLSDGTALPDGQVKLLHVSPGGFEAKYVENVDAEGMYNFGSVVLDKYLVVAVADTVTYPDQFPTYYTRSIFWEEADTLILEGDINQINIDLEAIVELSLNGAGSINGVLEEEVPEDGRVLIRRRIANAGVSVRRKRRTSRTNWYPNSRLMEEYELVAFIYTDKNGEFSFDFLEPDTYRINIQYPGFPMDESSDIDIVVGDKKSGAESRTVKAVVQNGKITVSENKITGLANDELQQLSVYPNPAKDYLNVVLPEGKINELDILLYDNKGSSINVRKVVDGGKAIVDMRGLPAGVYVLNIYNTQSNERLKSYKVILSD